MSVTTQINRIQSNILSAYSAIEEKGGELPTIPNSENLAMAILSIKSGGSGGVSEELLAEIIKLLHPELPQYPTPELSYEMGGHELTMSSQAATKFKVYVDGELLTTVDATEAIDAQESRITGDLSF